jgi:hypothetical protein
MPQTILPIAHRPRTTGSTAPAMASAWARTTRIAVRLWRVDALLTATGAVMLVAVVPFTAGLWLDPRVVTGAPVWLKPAKFAFATGLYMLTLAWIFDSLRAWRRTRRVVAWTTAVVFVVEVTIIALQAWRGAASHFNVATPFDAVLFRIMGAGIALQTLASVAVAVTLWRQAFDDRALGWAFRLGTVLAILGAATGGLMTRPTPSQIADAAAAGRFTVAGAHTVGAPDGGPGLPVAGWSTRAGDLRVAHFLGIHALQVLPLVAVLARRRPERQRVRTVLAAGALYALAFAAALAQALAGLPLVRLGA